MLGQSKGISIHLTDGRAVVRSGEKSPWRVLGPRNLLCRLFDEANPNQLVADYCPVSGEGDFKLIYERVRYTKQPLIRLIKMC